MKVDHVLLLGFGAPASRDEVRPFLQRVAQGRSIPETRLREVEGHYEAIGGSSPYNEQAFQIARQLESALKEAGSPLPVFTAMRNWKPFLEEVLADISGAGLKCGAAILLAPQRSSASCFRYKKALAQACEDRRGDLEYYFARPWHAHPLYIEAQSERASEALNKVPSGLRDSVPVIFTAHSIPLSMLKECAECHYPTELETLCSEVAKRLKLKNWKLCYQSRSGNPQEPWLSPDILQVLELEIQKGSKAVAVVPAGFLLENAEILYDLNIEAGNFALKHGIPMYLASAVSNHPKLIQLFRELVADAMERRESESGDCEKSQKVR